MLMSKKNYSLNDTKGGENMGNYYSYKRISTDTEKQNFNRQIKSLERYAAENGIEFLIDFTEEKSAKNFTERPQFLKLDTLVSIKQEIHAVIQAVDNTEYRTLLEYRYLCCMPWEDIASTLGYNIRWVHRMHGKALIAV